MAEYAWRKYGAYKVRPCRRAPNTREGQWFEFTKAKESGKAHLEALYAFIGDEPAKMVKKDCKEGVWKE